MAKSKKKPVPAEAPAKARKMTKAKKAGQEPLPKKHPRRPKTLTREQLKYLQDKLKKKF